MRWMVASIEMEYIKVLDNEYTDTTMGLQSASKYCKATVTNQLKTDGEFAKPWEQVTNLGTWIMQF
jgi:hypothetical protein